MPEGTLLSIRDVIRHTTLSRAQIYRLVKDKKFPQQIRISHSRVAWRWEDIDLWLRALTQQEVQ